MKVQTQSDEIMIQLINSASNSKFFITIRKSKNLKALFR